MMALGGAIAPKQSSAVLLYPTESPGAALFAPRYSAITPHACCHLQGGLRYLATVYHVPCDSTTKRLLHSCSRNQYIAKKCVDKYTFVSIPDENKYRVRQANFLFLYEYIHIILLLLFYCITGIQRNVSNLLNHINYTYLTKLQLILYYLQNK
jgi:hypothetical protein